MSSQDDPLGPDDATSLRPLAAGTRLDRHTVVRLCGVGGFAAVYRGTSDGGRDVAIKVLHPDLHADARSVARFRLEAEAIGRIDHPGVVDIVDVGTVADGRLFIVMDWIEGHTIKSHLARRGRLSLDETRAIVDQLCDALAAAHTAGVVHRDVKSSNVMLSPADAPLCVTLLDFGIAKLFETETGVAESFTSTRLALGSPHAMAPEQCRGDPVDARADVYSTGVLIYEMLTASPPFVAPSGADLRAMHTEAPAPRLADRIASLAAVDPVVQRCMAKDPADRFQRIDDVAGALRHTATTAEIDRGETVEAVAAYVSVRPDGDSGDAVLAAESVLDRAIETLTDFGLDIVSELPTAVVAVIASDDADDTAIEQSLVDLGLELDDVEGVHISVVVHRGRAVRDTAADVGWSGPLLDLGSWAASPPPGVTATRTAMAQLTDRYDTTGDRVIKRKP